MVCYTNLSTYVVDKLENGNLSVLLAEKTFLTGLNY